VALLAQGARFFELLGYFLAVLALGIVGGGVIWSLPLHVPQQRRALFIAASFAALTTLSFGALAWLVLSQPLAPEAINVQRRPNDGGRPAEDVTGGVHSVRVDVQPGGTVLFQGRELEVDEIVPHLRREYGNKRLSVAIHADANASIGVVQPVIRHLQQHGVDRFTLEVRD